jgi:uncharacterized protein (TIRG00374 family)
LRLYSLSYDLIMALARKKIIQFLVFLGLGATIFYLVFRNQNAAYQEQCRLDGIPEAECNLMAKLLHDFSTIDTGWILLVVAAFTVSNVFRALRWQMQFAPLHYAPSFLNSFLTILLGYFVNLGFPRMGEVARAGSLANYEKIPMEKVMGTLVVDRLMDFLCLGVVVALAFVVESGTLLQFIDQNRGDTTSSGTLLQNTLLLTVLLLFVAAAAALFLFRENLRRLPVFQKVSRLVKGFWDGLRSVFKLKNPALFIAYSAGIWLMFFLQCWFNLQAFAPTAHLGVGAAMMVFVFGTLGFVVPSPGGMGTFHALAIAALALYGVSGSDAFSYANIAFFTIQIFYNVVAGILALVLLPYLNKKPVEESVRVEA